MARETNMTKTQLRSREALKAKMPEIAKQYKSGLSLQKLAAQNKCSIKAMTDRLREHGVRIRKRGARRGVPTDGKLTIKQREKMREDIRSLKFRFLAQIARKYDVSRECVRQNAEIIGVTRYRNKKSIDDYPQEWRSRRK